MLTIGWDFHPGVMAGLACGAADYSTGITRLWHRAGRGRGVAMWRVVSAAAALMVLVLALLSLDELGHVLFSAHMVQHLLLLLVAPPLLVMAAPVHVSVWALPRRWRHWLGRWWQATDGLRALVRQALRPASVWVASAIVLWSWHLPRAYDAAVRHETIHALEHASFLCTGFAFWWLLFRHPGRRMDRGLGILYVFTAGLQCGLLGALLTLSRSPWYAVHAAATARLGPDTDAGPAGGGPDHVDTGRAHLPGDSGYAFRAVDRSEGSSSERARYAACRAAKRSATSW